MGKGLVIKYTYLSECSFQNQINNEKIEKTKKNIRALVDSFFSLLGDKSDDYTKIKSIESECCKGFYISKTASFSSITLELNEVLPFLLLTINCSKSFVAGEVDNLIIKLLSPDHFHSSFTERYMP